MHAAPYWEMRGTTVRAVEAELARIWHEATTEGDSVTEKGAPNARTSVMNLIITAPDQQAGDRILKTLLALGTRHPSRAIILHADPHADGDSLDARIATHCHDGENGNGRVCFEQLALTVRGEAARHLDGIVAPLLIHDLPIDVWWPGDPPFDDPVFNQLVELGDRLVVNASDFGNLPAGLKRLAAIRRRSGVGDVTWERLAPWHELTAQFFDAPRFRRYLPNLSRLVIRYAVPENGNEAEPPNSDTHPRDALPGGRGAAVRRMDRDQVGLAAGPVARAAGRRGPPSGARGALRDGRRDRRAGADLRRPAG